MPHTRSHALNPSIMRSNLVFVVSVGTVLFILLYVLAAWHYPGGSNSNSREVGFDLFTNYWCDLLGKQAKNGQRNPGQPFAMVAMIILCLMLSYFWYIIPNLFGYSKRLRSVLQLAGVGSMVVAPFIFTTYHDMIVNLAGSMGTFAMLGTVGGLYKYRFKGVLLFGLFCIILCGLNNYIYYTQHFIEHLPIIQKISFLLFLLWFNLVSLIVSRNVSVHE